MTFVVDLALNINNPSHTHDSNSKTVDRALNSQTNSFEESHMQHGSSHKQKLEVLPQRTQSREQLSL